MEEDRNGWGGVTPRDAWTCPECGVTSPVESWEDLEVYCESCGSHDARKCPACGQAFDSVFGDEMIERACIEATRTQRT